MRLSDLVGAMCEVEAKSESTTPQSAGTIGLDTVTSPRRAPPRPMGMALVGKGLIVGAKAAGAPQRAETHTYCSARRILMASRKNRGKFNIVILFILRDLGVPGCMCAGLGAEEAQRAPPGREEDVVFLRDAMHEVWRGCDGVQCDHV